MKTKATDGDTIAVYGRPEPRFLSHFRAEDEVRTSGVEHRLSMHFTDMDVEMDTRQAIDCVRRM